MKKNELGLQNEMVLLNELGRLMNELGRLMNEPELTNELGLHSESLNQSVLLEMLKMGALNHFQNWKGAPNDVLTAYR
jgi:hypothetical protein